MEWINVKERLPNKAGYFLVLVQYKSKYWKGKPEIVIEYYTKKNFWGELKDCITHWMPLPSPPDLSQPEENKK